MSAVCNKCGAPLKGEKTCAKCGTPIQFETTFVKRKTAIKSGHNVKKKVLMSLDFTKVSLWAFRIGVAFIAIAGLIQFVSGMVKIGDFSDDLKDADATLLWMVPYIIFSMLTVAGAVLLVLHRDHPKKILMGMGISALLIVLLIIFYTVAELAETNGFTIFCRMNVVSMGAIVTFLVLSAIFFVGARTASKK